MSSNFENMTAGADAEIGRLRRRLERERSIRMEAESIAETNLRDLYVKQRELKLLQEIAFAANEADNVASMMQTALELICRFIDWPVAHVYSIRGDILVPTAVWHDDVPEGLSTFREFTNRTSFASGKGLPGRVLVSKTAEWIRDVTVDGNFPRADAAAAIGIVSGFAFPVLTRGAVAAVLEFYDRKLHDRDDALIDITTHIATQLSRVIERCRSGEEQQLQMNRLAALHSVDIAIREEQDQGRAMQSCLSLATGVLGARGASILLVEANGGGLRRACVHGSLSQPDTAMALLVLSSRQVIIEGDTCRYCGIPLVFKGRIRGVLEIYGGDFDPVEPSWASFLQTLAGQLAVAIDNSELMTNLQLGNAELRLAYDATIEGWSRALDLRDHETEGHSRRVTEMTLALAEAFGIKGDALVDIRRGALLHDIGKMGIPDGVLLKPGPLTDDEWVVMKKHPQYAFELLSPIAFLADALDIPLNHHEKWDGTGYPRGLAGEDIPLAARIFAIVDVWDALSSNRPYRRAWPPEKVMAHLRSLSGTHFDPAVVEAFLRLAGSQTIASSSSDYRNRLAA